MSEVTQIDALRPTRRKAAVAGQNGFHPASQSSFSFAAPHPDAEARERALRVDTSFVVEAPAGSGKTGLLIQRYLTLLANGDVQSPEQVLAITFTRAAADEIRERLLSALEAAGSQAPISARDDFALRTRSLAAAALARDRERGWALLADPQRLRVRTIDSVCSEIVRTVPVMSGGGATLKATEQPRALYAQAARRTLLHMGERDTALSDAIERLLLHRNGSVAGCVDLISEMLALREQWGGLLPGQATDLSDEFLENTTRPALDRALEDAICADLQAAENVIPRDLLQQLAIAAADMSGRPGYKDAPSPLLCCAGCPEAPQAFGRDLERWKALASLLITGGNDWRKSYNRNHLGLELTRADQARISEISEKLNGDKDVLAALVAVSSLPGTRYSDTQWALLKALFRVLAQAQLELKLVFGEAGECDFAELALLAQAALNENDGPRSDDAALGTDVRHLLVDEMQDTSISQYALLETLTRDWADEGRTLFLVGDPKQSIYLFRQARVERFVRTMQQRKLGEIDLELLQLSTNFRSRPELIDAANANFSRIFQASARPQGDIAHTPASASRVAMEGIPAGETWHAAATAKAQRTEEKKRLVRRHAREIRQVVLEWRARPLSPGRTDPWRIAVLVASRQELKPVIAEFRGGGERAPIPFRAKDVEHLAEQPEILDLLALTSALQHRADRVAWLAVLRAPWCGLSLADLHQLAGADDPKLRRQPVPLLLQEREAHLSEDGASRLRAIRPVLESALERSGRVYLPELVETAWYALAADQYLDPAAVRNAGQFFALLHDAAHERQGDDLLRAVERRMERLYAAPRLDDDAVHLTTIHGAKGLEWDVVLIPELDRRAPTVRGRLLEWEEMDSVSDGSAGVVFAPIQETYEKNPALNRWVRVKRAERLAAERKRLFYVASTRAREALHLWATAEQRDNGELTPPVRSLLQAAWHAAAKHFVGVAPRPVLAPTGPTPAEAQRPTPSEQEVVLQLAAVADPAATEALLDHECALPDFGNAFRLPLGTLQTLHASHPQMHLLDDTASTEAFARPEGSFRARSLGNAVHAFLEQAARHIAEGNTPDQLLHDLPNWRGRIDAVLRNDGLGTRDRERLLTEVETAVANTLRNPTGQWLLSARCEARSEHALTFQETAAARVRLDRIFRAGALPQSIGNSHLWIVDYKTGSQKIDDREVWVREQRTKYGAQMGTYAAAFPGETVNLALWYPALEQLIWWPR